MARAARRHGDEVTAAAISLTAATYDRLKAYSLATGVPMSRVVESLLVDLPVVPPRGIPEPDPVDFVEPGPTRETVNMKVSGDLHTRIFEVAFNTRRTMPVVVSEAIDRMLDALGAPKGRRAR